MTSKKENRDLATLISFGKEWSKFDQTQLSEGEIGEIFRSYFKVFPWHLLSEEAVGFDLGCGSGRWARCVAPRVGRLFCVDASPQALAVAQQNGKMMTNCEYVLASVDQLPFDDNSMDFGYAIGVLHHVPDTAGAIQSCVKKLKPGAPLLLYLYYGLENRPLWFLGIWKLSDLIRKRISISPFWIKYFMTQAIAVCIYYPLARLAHIADKLGVDARNFPLFTYRNRSLYVMRTDALDRFGTPLEQRFTAEEIRRMMNEANLEHIQFSDSLPYWCAVGVKRVG